MVWKLETRGLMASMGEVVRDVRVIEVVEKVVIVGMCVG
jgi:hypothetical protein